MAEIENQVENEIENEQVAAEQSWTCRCFLFAWTFACRMVSIITHRITAVFRRRQTERPPDEINLVTPRVLESRVTFSVASNVATCNTVHLSDSSADVSKVEQILRGSTAPPLVAPGDQTDSLTDLTPLSEPSQNRRFGRTTLLATQDKSSSKLTEPGPSNRQINIPIEKSQATTSEISQPIPSPRTLRALKKRNQKKRPSPDNNSTRSKSPSRSSQSGNSRTRSRSNSKDQPPPTDSSSTEKRPSSPIAMASREVSAPLPMDKDVSPDQIVLYFQLELDACLEQELFQCDKHNNVLFGLGPSLYKRRIILYSNYKENCADFNRKKYEVIHLDKSIPLKVSGSFHFYYIDAHTNQALGEFYIIVRPELKIKNGEDKLHLNSIQCQTVVSKLMGSMNTWLEKLNVSINTGYNMIHWTPIQELGDSGSAYCLKNQYRVNPQFAPPGSAECTLEDIKRFIDYLQDKYGLLSITDIVLNHTSNETEWLHEHPEASYNCFNSPWLRPAFLLDALFWSLSQDIIDGRWVEKGVSAEVNQEHQLEIIKDIFTVEYLPTLNIHELYLCDEEKLLGEFERYLLTYIFGEACASGEDSESLPIQQYPTPPEKECDPIRVLRDPEYRRFGAKIDFQLALLNVCKSVEYREEPDARLALTNWINCSLRYVEKILKHFNDTKTEEINQILRVAVENVISGASYDRVQHNGPRIPRIDRTHPLAKRYFTVGPSVHEDVFKLAESIYEPEKAKYFMAHNGWVMDINVLTDFASESSLVYLRRELVCWEDSVKLRYGAEPEDSPFLWKYMEEYVRLMALNFHGLRLDNCHSTPIKVAQYYMDVARRANPDLYVIAELFTSNEKLDPMFVNKLGIISLIREAKNEISAHKLADKLHSYGERTVGSFVPLCAKMNHPKGTQPQYLSYFLPSKPHAIFFDQTHDNPSPIQLFSPFYPISTAALVCASNSAIGSNRGFDELVPHQIDIVGENRTYGVWEKDVFPGTGIIRARLLLNNLHKQLAQEGFSEIFVDKRDKDAVAVTRHNPRNHKTVVLTARPVFSTKVPDSPSLSMLEVKGSFDKIMFELKLYKDDDPQNEYVRHPEIINGLKNMKCFVKDQIKDAQGELIEVFVADSRNLINFKNFPPSSVAVMCTKSTGAQLKALEVIHSAIEEINKPKSKIVQIISALNLLDLNFVLFRTEAEERADSGHGVYVISASNRGLIYAGLAGIMHPLYEIRKNNDLGHEFCEHIRTYSCLPEFIVNRLSRRKSTMELAEWLRPVLGKLQNLQTGLIPRYFDSIMYPLYVKLLDHAYSLHGDFVAKGDDFIQRLALGGVALVGSHKAAPLPPLEPEAIPQIFKGLSPEEIPTMAAGLPHFAVGYNRSWGRDTFIAVKGLLILTGRYDEAKVLILGYAGAMRHGLIPNLLDGGKNSRFNCRDAIWWWLHAIKAYIRHVPDGHTILKAPVRRVFADDRVELLQDTIIEGLQEHFKGIDFVEKNAGTAIDAKMKSEGFHIKIHVDRKTGFIHGGNQWNCGTWMDKMGSSHWANNFGHPSTPRNGAAIEIVALSASILSCLAYLHKEGKFPVSGVENGTERWTFEEWYDRIKDNFEKHFFIDENCTSPHKNRVNIYRDTIGATWDWPDYQLRPNFLIAMVVASKLFKQENGVKALEVVEETLQGPLGMKTLDPTDYRYRPYYDNLDSSDYLVGCGFNYHNGPEWLWLTGFYLQARLIFLTEHDIEIPRVNHWISEHYKHLVNSEWLGLPELTNKDGAYCEASCPIQAWSHSTLIELLHRKSALQHFV